jgi:hypothetical protein
MFEILIINFLAVVAEVSCYVHIIARIVSKLSGTVTLLFCSENAISTIHYFFVLKNAISTINKQVTKKSLCSIVTLP